MSARFPKPRVVAIVAMGASSSDYTNRCARAGGRHGICDETWAINAMGGIIEHDRLFAMDDIGELQQDARLGKNVAKSMLEWMPHHPGPVYTTRRYGDRVPGAIPYPTEEVLNCIGFPYLNNSVSYAVAYGIYLRVKKMMVYGADFTYKNQHIGEAGRGNVEWLLGIAGERGINVEVGPTTSLLDASERVQDRLYGYDEPVIPELDQDTGRWRLRFPEREDSPESSNGAQAPTQPQIVEDGPLQGGDEDEGVNMVESAGAVG